MMSANPFTCFNPIVSFYNPENVFRGYRITAQKLLKGDSNTSAFLWNIANFLRTPILHLRAAASAYKN